MQTPLTVLGSIDGERSNELGNAEVSRSRGHEECPLKPPETLLCNTWTPTREMSRLLTYRTATLTHLSCAWYEWPRWRPELSSCTWKSSIPTAHSSPYWNQIVWCQPRCIPQPFTLCKHSVLLQRVAYSAIGKRLCIDSSLNRLLSPPVSSAGLRLNMCPTWVKLKLLILKARCMEACFWLEENQHS